MNEMFGSNQSLESVDVIRQGIPWGGLRLKAELCRCPPLLLLLLLALDNQISYWIQWVKRDAGG